MDILNNISIDKSTPIPIYYQLKKQLTDMVVNGTLQSGDMLPAEVDFCQRLDISRPTVRQALSSMVDEGRLVRYKGIGTFVARPKVEDRFLSKLQSFNDEMRDKDITPRTEVLSLEMRAAIPHCNAMLGLGEHDPLVFLSRLRYADDRLVVFVETYLSYQRFGCILGTDMTRHSLYDVLEREANIRVDRAEREIEAVNAHKREAERLDVPLGQALLKVSTIAYAGQQRVEYSTAYYRTDRTRFLLETGC